MPSKEEKARLKSLFKSQERQRFEAGLPMSREQFQRLFDFLDEKQGEEGCDHTLRFCMEFLAENQLENQNEVVDWLKNNHGYCDCEVLANIEEKFEN